MDANARMIAAAPALLAALQLCVIRDRSLESNATVMEAIAQATEEPKPAHVPWTDLLTPKQRAEL
jgi:hypothetical protein